VEVELPALADAVVAGIEHSCARLVDGTVWCWGNDTRDELGVTAEPLIGTESLVPALLTGLPNEIEAIGAFAAHTCVRAAGRLQCWGWNESGALGAGPPPPASSAEPLVVAMPPGPVGDFGGGGFIFLGGAHTCAVLGSDLYCWGRGLSGEVGTGTSPFTPITVPSRVNLSDVTRVAGGTVHTCAVAAGAVHCWGGNERGRLGNGNETATNLPGEPIRVP
jgi:alpha-tubulin suppressor-like RCC1 family protein